MLLKPIHFVGSEPFLPKEELGLYITAIFREVVEVEAELRYTLTKKMTSTVQLLPQGRQVKMVALLMEDPVSKGLRKRSENLTDCYSGTIYIKYGNHSTLIIDNANIPITTTTITTFTSSGTAWLTDTNQTYVFSEIHLTRCGSLAIAPVSGNVSEKIRLLVLLFD